MCIYSTSPWPDNFPPVWVQLILMDQQHYEMGPVCCFQLPGKEANQFPFKLRKDTFIYLKVTASCFFVASTSLKGKDANCSTSKGSVQSKECEEIQNTEWRGRSRAGCPLWLRKVTQKRHILSLILSERGGPERVCAAGAEGNIPEVRHW